MEPKQKCLYFVVVSEATFWRLLLLTYVNGQKTRHRKIDYAVEETTTFIVVCVLSGGGEGQIGERERESTLQNTTQAIYYRLRCWRDDDVDSRVCSFRIKNKVLRERERERDRENIDGEIPLEYESCLL